MKRSRLCLSASLVEVQPDDVEVKMRVVHVGLAALVNPISVEILKKDNWKFQLSFFSISF